MVPGGRSVGVPGLVRMLESAHQAHGRAAWSSLWEPTAALAETGFVVTPRMHASIRGIGETPMNVLARDAEASAYFLPDGEPLPVGHRLTNPALARTVRRIASDGADAFYTGPLAEAIVARVQQAADNPGLITVEDLARYRSVQRTPVCVPFAGRSVCGHPPPTSGGVTTLQILGMLEADGAPTTPHRFVEAARLAWADRGRYLADPAAVPVPTDALLSADYLAMRAGAIGASRGPAPAPGELPLPEASEAPLCPEGRDTTHLVVVDGEGNVVSMTSSIENAFGSGLFVEGFLLNNQLTDFDFAPTRPDGSPVANRVEACKRPRSSMSPVVVLGEDGVELAVGSPGGSRIIQYTARVVVDVLEHGVSVQEAIARPNLVSRGDHVEVEVGCGTPAPDAALQVLGEGGHPVVRTELNSGLHGIQRTARGWRAGVDPRREGAAVAVE
jgi:gamma-glutamyltranspeptidase/glutathione hydrolase